MSSRGVARRIAARMYRLYGVRRNVALGADVHIGLGSILWAPRELIVGNDVYIGKRCTIEVDGSIGNHVLIGNDVGIVGRYDHNAEQVGTAITQSMWIGDYPELGNQTTIEDDVWVGYGATILSGVKVGRGALIGARAVVTADVDPYDVVVGTPARRVRRRFTDAEIARHEIALDLASGGTEND